MVIRGFQKGQWKFYLNVFKLVVCVIFTAWKSLVTIQFHKVNNNMKVSNNMRLFHFFGVSYFFNDEQKSDS